MQEIQAAKNDLMMREELAMQKLEEAVTRGEMDAQTREAKINQMAAERLENIAVAERDVIQRMHDKEKKEEASEREED